MSPIRHQSTLQIPGAEPPEGQPRYEIGDWFVTIYYADPEVDADDATCCMEVARALQGSLGKQALMFLNQHHPSIPLEHTGSSAHAGKLEEMHALPPRHKHVHLELIGPQREIGFEKLGVLDALKRRLQLTTWNEAEPEKPPRS